MAGNAASIEEGLQYQELYGWFRVLELLSPANSLSSVAIEDKAAKHFDDVTLRPWPRTSHPAQFLQVKFHVDLSDQYSSASFMGEPHGYLLKKAWATWEKLSPEYPNLELRLISTWSWDPKDPLAQLIRRHRLEGSFVAGEITGAAKQIRADWWGHLDNPSEERFQPFLRALRFRVGYVDTDELLRDVQERMRTYGLAHDEASAWKGANQVREWIIAKHPPITLEHLNATIDELGLRASAPEPSVTLYVHTVVKEPLETGSEYELDWRHYFKGHDELKGHELYEPADWNGKLLPELYDMRKTIRGDARARDGQDVRLLRLRGSARLSPWLAVGFAFRETDGWTLETDQYGQRWRTDEPASTDRPCAIETEDLSGSAETVALAVEVSGPVADDVRANLVSMGNPAGRLLIVRSPVFGKEAIRSGSDLVSLGQSVKACLQSLRPRAKHLLLFYRGPAAGAAFLGWHLNAVAGDIQLYEEELGVYSPSLLLGQP